MGLQLPAVGWPTSQKSPNTPWVPSLLCLGFDILCWAATPLPLLLLLVHLGSDTHLEKAMAPHSSTLAWKIPWMEEPGRLESMGSLRVRHDWATSLSLFTVMHWRRKWQPIPVFLPGESQGRVPSLRSHRVGNDWSNLAAAAAADTLSMWTILWHVDSYLVHPCLMAFGLNYSATGRGRRYSFYSSYVPEPDESYLI